MTIPNNFNEWENLQDLIRKDHNKAVKNYFKNQPDNDISTPKSRLKHSCLIKDEDTAAMTQLRMWLFEVTIGHAQSLQRPVYGVPVSEYQREITYKPQIKLFFREQLSEDMVDDRTSPATGEITFRLVSETSQSISRTKAETLAREIKGQFTSPIFVWEKGWYKYTYKDIEKGYDFRLLVKSKAEGTRICRSVLAIQNDTFDIGNQQFVEHDRSYSLNPGSHTVYGRSVKKFVKRPRVDVRFKYAQLLIHGQINAVNLVAVAGVNLKSVIQRINES